jgi:hypothetical protein
MQSWCRDQSDRSDEARLKQIDLSAAIHPALDEFGFGDLAFGLAILPRRYHGRAHRSLVVDHTAGKGNEEAPAGALKPALALPAAVLHGSAGWCLDLDGIGRLCPRDLGSLPCRSRPMLLAVTASPSSGTG